MFSGFSNDWREGETGTFFLENVASSTPRQIQDGNLTEGKLTFRQDFLRRFLCVQNER